MTAALILCRFAHFVSAMLLFGASVFLAALATPRLRGDLARPVGRMIGGAIVVVAATCVLWLLLEGGEMGGDWGDAFDPAVLASVLSDTAFGHVWQVRLALAVALVGVWLWRRTPPALLAVLAGFFLASLGFAGHAAMHQGAVGLAERANQALHLIAGGFWLGALTPLLLCLSRLRDPELKREATTALSRFSGLGHFAVGAALLTGFVNTATILGRWPVDFSSPYQALLSLKIVSVATMALLALYNRYRLVPRLALAPEESLRALSRSTVAEILLGAVVLALVSAFATFAPE